MNIQKDIADWRSSYVSRTGQWPDRLYLGRLEMNRLIDWTVEHGYIDKKDNFEDYNITDDSRPEINGMKVYLVNELTHVGFSS